MKLRLLLIATVLSLSVISLIPGHGSAISDSLPNPSQFNGSGSYTPDMKLEVATGIDGAGGLQATVSDVLVYMNTLSAINLYGGGHNCTEDSNTDLPTDFVFRRLGADNAWVTFYRVSSASLPCGKTTVNLDTYDPTNYLHAVYGNKKFMKVNIIATASSSLVGRAIATNAFSLALATPYPNNFISYWGAPTSGDKFAMQDRNKAAPSPCSTPNGSSWYCPSTTFNLEFGSDCTVTQRDTWAQLRWFDDDAGALEPASGIKIDLYDETVPGRVPLYTSQTSNVQVYNAKFGPNVPGNAWYRTQPNHKYHWTWSNVSRPNGIQFDLPYEAINHEVDCKVPDSNLLSINCTTMRITGYSVDGDNTAAALKVLARIGSSDQPVVTANLSGASPYYSGHYFSVPIPAGYKDSRTHTVHMFAYGLDSKGVQYSPPLEFPDTQAGTTTFNCPQVCPPNCNPTVCPNLPGGPYTTPPPPYQLQPNGDCILTPTVCTNLAGGPYTAPPSGYFVDPADGTCYQDVCNNIDGPQRTPPPGYTSDGAGGCYVDVCNNIDGLQKSAPGGMVEESDGTCRNTATCAGMTTSGVIIRGQPFTIDVGHNYFGVLNPSRPSDTLTVNIIGVYNNPDMGYNANSGSLRSGNITITADTGTHDVNWSLSGADFDRTVSCTGQFTVDGCSNIAGIQNPNPALMNMEADGRCTNIPACGGVTTSGLLESGIGFTVKVTVTYTGLLTPSRPTDSMSVSFSGGIPGNPNVNFTQTSTSSNSGVLVSDPVPVNAPLGDYTVQWVISGADFGSSSPRVCPSAGTSTIKVGKRPYFRVYGGDIRSGGNFAKASKCNVPDPEQGSIIGQYVNGLGGAGTELANIALIRVSGVASADLRTVAPTEPNGLTFANTNLPSGIAINPPDTMGGYYSNTGYCAPDYFNDERFESTDPRLVTDASTSVNISNTTQYPDGQQTLLNNGGRIKIVGNGNISVRHTFFVDGDLDITKDITYPGNVDADPLKNPYLVIIVRGNIFIDPKVKNLTGLFIAQPRYKPDGSTMAGTGRIYTCRDQNGDPAYNDNTKYSSNGSNGCLDKLTVTGGFIAQRILLQRTVNGLSGASIHETADSGNISEVFQETPELYMGRPVFKQKNDKADSIKSLPPIL